MQRGSAIVGGVGGLMVGPLPQKLLELLGVVCIALAASVEGSPAILVEIDEQKSK